MAGTAIDDLEEILLDGLPPDDKLTMEDVFYRARKSYEELDKKRKEDADLYSQAIQKVNGQLATKMKKLRDDQKKQLSAKYREFSESQTTDFTTDQVNELRGHMSAILSRFGDQHAELYQKTMLKVNDFEGTAKAEVQAWYREVTSELDSLLDRALVKLNDATYVLANYHKMDEESAKSAGKSAVSRAP